MFNDSWPRTMGRIAAVALTACASPVLGDTSERDVPWITPESVELDLTWFSPVRAQYTSITYLEDEPEVQPVRAILTLDDAIAGPGRAGVLIRWLGMDKDGAATDTVLLDRQTFAVQNRIAPTRYAMISYALHQDGVVHVAKNDFENNQVTESTLDVEHKAFDIMALPYLFAAMDLTVGDRFAIPIHNPFRNRYSNLHIHVSAVETITIADGRELEATRVEYYAKPTREAACERFDVESQRVSVSYYVSREAPYWIKQRVWTKVPEPSVARREMIIDQWQPIEINAANLDELVQLASESMPGAHD